MEMIMYEWQSIKSSSLSMFTLKTWENVFSPHKTPWQNHFLDRLVSDDKERSLNKILLNGLKDFWKKSFETSPNYINIGYAKLDAKNSTLDMVTEYFKTQDLFVPV